MKTTFSILILLFTTQIAIAQQFTEQKNYFPDLAWGSIANADFDLDGDQDLLICGRNAQNLAITKIYRNEKGRFIDIDAEIENVMLSSMVWADFNNDKYPDILISGKNNDGNAVTLLYRNMKNGTFSAVSTIFTGISSGSVAVADYDLDGKLDILIAGKTKTTAISKIYKNLGNFQFAPTDIELTGVYNSDVAWADFNNDNYPDILISGESGFNRFTKVYLNQKNGSFREIYSELPQLGSSAVACADFDNDNNIDILLSGLDIYGNEKTQLFVNDGKFGLTDIIKRGFKQADYVLPNIAYGTINTADLDNDNDIDLIFTGKGAKKIASVYLNEGNFNFKNPGNSLTGVYHSSLTVFDYNGDKKPDIFYMGLDEKDQLKSILCQNKGGASLNKSNQKQKTQLIKPAFNFSMAKIGKPVKFINQTKSELNKAIVFDWNFGDGSVSNDDNPTHTYTKEGRYTVVLTAKVGENIETFTKTLSVQPKQIQVISFTEREMLVLKSKALNLLHQYELLTDELGKNLLGDDEKERADLQEQIINLFLSRQIVVFDDLNPASKTGKLKEIEAYSSDIILMYPDGIDVEIDIEKARMTSIRQHGKSLYSVDFITTKRTDGYYDSKMSNGITNKLAFRVAFNKEKSNFINLKFVGIRNYYEQSFEADEKAIEEMNKIEISNSEQEQIDNAGELLLKNYIRNLSLLGNPEEEDDEKVFYEEAFVKLFTDSASKIYNDIDPESKENSFLPADYIKNYRLVYPEGINSVKLNIDSALYKPVLEDNGIYYRYIYADKNFSGNYKAKSKNSSSENLAFKMVFKKRANSFQDFKFAGIDQSALNFYQSANLAAIEDTTTYTIPKFKRNGFSVGITGGAGLGTVYIKNTILEKLDGKQIWDVKPAMGFSGGIELNYFFTNHLALRVGLSYSAYSTDYIIKNDSIRDSEISYDANSDQFNKTLISDNYKSTIKYSTINIPVQLHWVSSEARKIGLFVKTGINFSIPLVSSQNSSGSLNYYGYYPGPDQPDAMRELDLKELGFYNIPDNEDVAIYYSTGYSISFLASIGVNIPVGYFTTIQLGPELLWGLSDLSANEPQNDVFSNTSDNQGTTIRNYGFRISINYKF